MAEACIVAFHLWDLNSLTHFNSSCKTNWED